MKPTHYILTCIASVGCASLLSSPTLFTTQSRSMLFFFIFASLLCAICLYLRLGKEAVTGCTSGSALCLAAWMLIALCSGGSPLPIRYVLAGGAAWFYYTAARHAFGKVGTSSPLRPLVASVSAVLSIQCVCAVVEIVLRMHAGRAYNLVSGLFDNPIGLTYSISNKIFIFSGANKKPTYSFNIICRPKKYGPTTITFFVDGDENHLSIR